VSRLGGRFVSGLDGEAALEIRGQTVHQAGSNDWMPLELDGESLQEGARCRG
jgi:hypothetical protein